MEVEQLEGVSRRIDVECIELGCEGRGDLISQVGGEAGLLFLELRGGVESNERGAPSRRHGLEQRSSMVGDPADPLPEVAFDGAGTEQFAMRAELPVAHGDGEGFLVLEVLVNRTGRAADALRDLFDGWREVALGVQLEQGVDDRLAGAEAPRDPSVLSLRGHGCRR